MASTRTRHRRTRPAGRAAPDWTDADDHLDGHGASSRRCCKTLAAGLVDCPAGRPLQDACVPRALAGTRPGGRHLLVAQRHALLERRPAMSWSDMRGFVADVDPVRRARPGLLDERSRKSASRSITHTTRVWDNCSAAVASIQRNDLRSPRGWSSPLCGRRRRPRTPNATSVGNSMRHRPGLVRPIPAPASRAARRRLRGRVCS